MSVAHDQAHQALRTMNLTVDDWKKKVEAVAALHVPNTYTMHIGGDFGDYGDVERTECAECRQTWPCLTSKVVRYGE